MSFSDPNLTRPEVLLDDWLTRWHPTDAGADVELDDRAIAFRRELGLPTNKPIVMTGHQSVFWHAGVLAKYLAAQALAERVGGIAAWCVPDQDVVEPGRLRRPVRREGGVSDTSPGLWRVEETELLQFKGIVNTIPAGALPVGEVINDAAAGFANVTDRLLARRDEPTAARQVWSAHQDLLQDRIGLSSETPTVFATDLGNTTLFHQLVDSMRYDPAACTGSYNKALSAHPGAGIRELILDVQSDNIELPLWRLVPGEPRRAVFAHELPDTDPAALAPRALLLTGLLRAAGCDLFLHGTGGGEYDKVTEHWFADWLGRSLLPAGVVSATARIDLGVPDVDKADLRDAIWRAHHARHSPAMLGDDAAHADKLELVEKIDAATPSDRVALFAEMHGLLGRVRTQRGDRLGDNDRKIETIRAALADAEIARDRTWPWMLLSDETLGALCAEIRGRLLSGVREKAR